MFNEQYYQNKKKQLQDRLVNKAFDFYNQTKKNLIEMDKDIASINQDLQEVEIQIKDQKNAEPEKKDIKSKLPK